MKKSFTKIAFIAVFGMIAGYGINTAQNDTKLSDLALDNIEALARGEINPDCPNGCVSGWGGCRCNGWYPQFAEYNGWN